ncbi:MAG: hypothetical protein GX567_17125 [Clostridia bacterium]|nr:hypothetical protein [Clostridia bacterium]
MSSPLEDLIQILQLKELNRINDNLEDLAYLKAGIITKEEYLENQKERCQERAKQKENRKTWIIIIVWMISLGLIGWYIYAINPMIYLILKSFTIFDLIFYFMCSMFLIGVIIGVIIKDNTIIAKVTGLYFPVSFFFIGPLLTVCTTESWLSDINWKASQYASDAGNFIFNLIFSAFPGVVTIVIPGFIAFIMGRLLARICNI